MRAENYAFFLERESSIASARSSGLILKVLFWVSWVGLGAIPCSASRSRETSLESQTPERPKLRRHISSRSRINSSICLSSESSAVSSSHCKTARFDIPAYRQAETIEGKPSVVSSLTIMFLYSFSFSSTFVRLLWSAELILNFVIVVCFVPLVDIFCVITYLMCNHCTNTYSVYQNRSKKVIYLLTNSKRCVIL